MYRTLIMNVVVLLCVGLCSAELIQQPDVVPGETLQLKASRRSDGAATPGQATHVNAKGPWRLYDGDFPSLKQLAKLPDDPVSIYGLYTDPSLYVQFRDDIKAVGFTNFRVGQISAGSKLTDAGISAMIEDNVSVMIVLGATKRDEFDSDGAYIKNALKSFATIIERYGPNGSLFKDNPDLPYRPVTCFQVLNEPNFQYMYRGDNTNAMIPIRHKLYSKLLPRTYDMVKKRWPDCTVVGWTCGGASAQDLYFVTNALKINPDMARCFDVFSTHPYVCPVPPETNVIRSWGGYSIPDMLGKIRKAFAAAGRSPRSYPVWYTEGGWKLRQQDGGMNKGDGLPAGLHAAYYVRYYALGLRIGVARIMPMYTVDADGFNGGIFNRTSGWTRDNENPMRQAALAIKNMIRLMPNPKLKMIISDGKDGVFAYEFISDKLNTESGTTVMAWKVTGGGMDLELPVSYDKPLITDMLGNSEPAMREGGSVTVEIGPCPVYVTQQ